MSRHLRMLRASGLVKVEEDQGTHDARLRVYGLRSAPFVALQAWLDQVQALWTDQLESFKDYGAVPTQPDPNCQSVLKAGGVGPVEVDARWKFTRK